MNPEFDQYASEYSRLLSDPLRDGFASDPAFFHRRKWMLICAYFAQKKLDPSKMSWLDVGCGQGDLLRLAGGSFSRALGCDPSSHMMRSSAQLDVHQQPSPTELPFADESFDFVTAVCVYHHVHGNDRTLLTQSIRRVLKPGGMLCVIEHNPWNPVTQAIVKRCPVDADAELLTAAEAGKLARSADLRILETRYFLYFPEPVFRRIGRIEIPLQKLPFGGQFASFCLKPTGREQ
jgi:SAM-dependent methyltransferase